MNGIGERKARWNEFLYGNGNVRQILMVNTPWLEEERPSIWPELKQERIDWILRKYEMLMKRAQWLDDDTVPFLDMLTGTDIFPEAFGCAVYRPDFAMPSARPLVHTASEAAKLKVPMLWDSSLAYLFEMADKIQERTGKDAVFKVPDNQSPMDIATLIWDKNEFYIAILEEPEAVKELAYKVYLLQTEFFDEWFRRYGKNHIAHYPNYYMDHGITLADDEVGIVSSEIFKEFYLPELCALSDRYSGLGMHCCADSRHQWENFKLIPNLRLLNLARPNDILVEAYKFFADFTAQYHCWCGDGPAWTWPSQRPENARIVCDATAENKEEALEISERFREMWEIKTFKGD
ncbi:MAG TPA: uroporphyrinogen decarboxylase family protein [Oscillospiraceae bacterium]|nr:uroporphyrinogen decarboxylase family protein [Oscillospiraceae bacterium]HPS33859.1 uroporphyrinogen decarboxylase family protein [Oscillospiraceae bacterium]